MLRDPLHTRGADGNCTECGEPWVCSSGRTIHDDVIGSNVRECPKHGRDLQPE